METAKSVVLSVGDLARYTCGRSWFGEQVVKVWTARTIATAYSPPISVVAYPSNPAPLDCKGGNLIHLSGWN